MSESKCGWKQYVYRQDPGRARSGTFEIGKCDNPRTHEGWCDRRVCEGFWGDEEQCRQVVVMLNEAARKPDKPALDAAKAYAQTHETNGNVKGKPVIEPVVFRYFRSKQLVDPRILKAEVNKIGELRAFEHRYLGRWDDHVGWLYEFSDACDKEITAKEYEAEKIGAATPSPVGLVVEYWRHGPKGNLDSFRDIEACKTVDRIITECLGKDWPSSAIGVKLTCKTCLAHPITEGEYESARKPAKPNHIVDTSKMVAKPAIEPLGGNIDTGTMYEKIQELIARVNALEGAGRDGNDMSDCIPKKEGNLCPDHH